MNYLLLKGTASVRTIIGLGLLVSVLCGSLQISSAQLILAPQGGRPSLNQAPASSGNLQGSGSRLQPTVPGALTARTGDGSTIGQNQLMMPQSSNAVQPITQVEQLIQANVDPDNESARELPWLHLAVVGIGIAAILGVLSFIMRGTHEG